MFRKIIVIVAGLALLVALLSTARWLWPSAPKPNRTRYVGLGQMLAAEAAKAVNERGRIVAVINPEHELPESPLHDLWTAFQAELKRHPTVRLAAAELVPEDPVEASPGAGCSRAQLRQILEKHAQTDAIVFFFGLPEWGLAAVTSPPRPAAKVLIVESRVVPTKTQYSGYFTSGIASALIGLRSEAISGGAADPQTPREWFDKHYQMFTPQNYETLPD